ncbi:hypothetical protein [Nitrososphaera sp. AFS]|uniref:hypothetical protein n=1 Tax=Nitrososphaera sp. AFS TaxID=2301191 RepID=UPI0013922211|nr:hypothetical protein [Nitrososphaera sp. AFS]NAL78158.1 hypothetical protein [Nitrososphaera sp. AFS]
MLKWKKDAKEFTVGVNYSDGRGYQSSIPIPVMERLGKTDTIKFVINKDNNTIELISGKFPMSRKGMKVT